MEPSDANPNSRTAPQVECATGGLLLPGHLRAFEGCCQRWEVSLTIGLASDLGVPYVGRSGYLPLILPAKCQVRRDTPNEGLIAFDAGRGNLPEELAAQGLCVSSDDDGFVLQDDAGHRFYQTYDLGGVFDSHTGGNAFTPDRGHLIWADLNRRLGGDFILLPPRDLRAPDPEVGASSSPQLPVLLVQGGPQASVSRANSADELCALYDQHGFHWPYA